MWIDLANTVSVEIGATVEVFLSLMHYSQATTVATVTVSADYRPPLLVPQTS